MSLPDEIAKLEALHRAGTLSDAEFAAAKARLIEGRAPPSSGDRGTHRALWALVIVVFLVGAGIVVLLHEAGETLRLVAGSAAVAAGLAGAALGAMEDLGVLAIGGLGLGALAIGAVVFLGLAPVLIVPVVVVLAIGALWSWFGELFTG